jgi:vacuolar-type H+-ATPase subunit C/Vma6
MFTNAMKILKTHDRNYPTDYLNSRIKGRRPFLITEWLRLLYSPQPFEGLGYSHYRDILEEQSDDGIRQWLTREFHWVYYQMNSKLQNLFFPFFLYYEIEHTLMPCFRYGFGKDKKDAIRKLLSMSLLSDQVTKVLEKGDQLSVLEDIEVLFLNLSDLFKGLKESFFSPDRLMSLEEKFMHAYLEHIVHSDIHPDMKRFFNALIDIRNIRVLLKHLRWNIPAVPVFVQGGAVSVARLRKFFAEHDISAVKKLVSGLTHAEIEEDDPAVCENVLYKRLSETVRKAARDPLDVGLILDYLWRCYMQALNLRIVLYRGSTKKETLERELLYG